ncbi:MAG: hypothetical protein KAJ75_01425 [Alphaproteobacteria bacterium]|nr:hypothetical protein [Alphaproteobacteria bacterium]
MSVAVRLSNELVNEAKNYAGVNFRSVPKQIEYWSKLGKIADENPDLPLSFIKDILLGKEELEAGEVEEFEFELD